MSDDTISRHAAVEACYNGWNKDYRGIAQDIKDLPPAQPEKRTEERTETHACDLISRQSAIDAIVAQTIGYTVDEIKAECEENIFNENGYLGGLKDAIEAIEDMPPEQPEVLACGEGELIAQPEIIHCGVEPRCETCEAFNKTRLLISQPQQRWIPCSKELPERNLVVLVTTRWGEVTEGVKLSGNAWFIGRGEENAFDSDIIAWMPLPEPYAERRTDE